MYTAIKLIDKDTDFSKLKITRMDWDVMVGTVPYYVGAIEGYTHSIGGHWGNNNLWCWKRCDEPSYDTIVPFDSDTPVKWGFEYIDHNAFLRYDSKHLEVNDLRCTKITRNGVLFYTVSGDVSHSVPRAIDIINRLSDDYYNSMPINFNEIDYANKYIIGRKIIYKGYKGVITQWAQNIGCISVAYSGDSKYKDLVKKAWHLWDDDEVFIDIVGYDHDEIEWINENEVG